MKYFKYWLVIATALIALSACEKKKEETAVSETPQIISSGISFGRYSLGTKDTVNAKIRLKFTPPTGKDERGELKFVVEISPNENALKNFSEVTDLFLEKGSDVHSESYGEYINSMDFALMDKDKFEIRKIEIKKTYDSKPNIIKNSNSPSLEFRGSIFLEEKEALKITDCVLRVSFTPKLVRLIDASD